MSEPRVTQPAALELARSISRGDAGTEVLARRPGRVTVRAESGSGPVIVKLWNLRDPRSMARRITRRTKGRNEWESLNHLRAAGVAVPTPLAFFPLRGRDVRHHEALIAEDLASCETLHGRMHACSKHGDSSEVQRLDDEVIRLTAAMIEADVIDNDHRLGNFVVRSDGAVYRLDFENATRAGSGGRRDKRLGVMIGALVSSHAWVTRYAPDQTPRFVGHLVEHLRLDDRALDRARQATTAEITRLAEQSGFALPRDLGW